jgi:hypothetical protein
LSDQAVTCLLPTLLLLLPGVTCLLLLLPGETCLGLPLLLWSLEATGVLIAEVEVELT